MQQISKIVAWSGGSSRDLMPTGPEFESPQVYFCLPFTIERVRFRNKRSSSSFLGFLQMFCAAAKISNTLSSPFFFAFQPRFTL